MAGGILMYRSNFLKRCIDLLKTLTNIWMKRKTLTELSEFGTGESDGNSSYGDPNKKVTTLMDLPEDITVDILTRLPVESLCRVQCVSKTFFDISRSPDFAALHNLRLHDSASNSLMRVTTAWHGSSSVWQSWQSFKYNSRKQTLTKSIHGSQICFEKYLFQVDFVFCNLFFLKTTICRNGPCLLVNPLKEEVLELPFSNIPVPTTNIGSRYTDWYGMGYDNITSTYKIVHVSAGIGCNSVVAQVLVLGTSSWRQIHLAPPFDVSSSFSGKRSKNPIYVGGHMHWLIYKTTKSPGCIISFNFNREEFYATAVPSSYGLKLLKFRGSLALVDLHPDEDNIKIWVLKSFDDEKNWELHHNITMKCRLAWAKICVEWEHGICFASADECYFLDLRNLSMKIEQLPTYSTPDYWPTIFRPTFQTELCMSSSIFSYTECLISLKNYGRLQKQGKVYSTWIQALAEVIYYVYPMIFDMLLGMFMFQIVLGVIIS